MILTDRQQKVLAYLSKPHDRWQVMDEFHLTLVSARELLRKLVQAGLLEQYRADPQGRGPPCMLYLKKTERVEDNGKNKPQAELVAVQERPEGNPQ